MALDKHHTARRRFDIREEVVVLAEKPLDDRQVAQNDSYVSLEQLDACPQDHHSLDLARARRARRPKIHRVREPLPRLRVAAGDPTERSSTSAERF